MADFGSNFTDAFSAVYGARRQAKQQATENERQAKMDAITQETFARQKKGWEAQDRLEKAVKDATSYRVPTGQNVTMVPGTFKSADEAMAAYTQKMAAPANLAVNATGVPAQVGAQPPMQPAPNMPAQAMPVAGQPPVQPPVQVAPNTPAQALPTGGQPLATLPATEATAQPATPTTPKMVATQDLFGHWQVVPEAETREASQAEGLRAAAGALMRQGDVEGAYDLRAKASNLRDLDIKEDHANFTAALDGVTRSLASGDATQVGSAVRNVLGALNQAKDGIEYKYEPTPDGKGMQLKMYEQSTGLPAPGKPVVFPSVDPKTKLPADMQLVNYLNQFKSSENFAQVFKENIAFADQVADRAAKDSKEQREAELFPLQKKALEANTAQSYAAIKASNETTAAAREQRLGAKAPGAISKEATSAYNSELTRIRNLIVTNNPELKGQALQDEIQTQLDPWFNNSPYGAEVARALQGSSGGGGGGGAPKPPAQPTALPKEPKIQVVDDTVAAKVSKALGLEIGKAGVQETKRATDQWRQQVNPVIQEFRKQIRSGKVNASTLNQLKVLIKPQLGFDLYPDTVIAANTTEAERKLIGISK